MKRCALYLIEVDTKDCWLFKLWTAMVIFGITFSFPAFSAEKLTCSQVFEGSTAAPLRGSNDSGINKLQHAIANLNSGSTDQYLSQITWLVKQRFDQVGVLYSGGPEEVRKDSLLDKQQMRFTISPEGTHPLNRFAAGIKKRFGISLIYSLPELFMNGYLIGGRFSAVDQSLLLNAQVAIGLRADASAAHEVLHAFFREQYWRSSLLSFRLKAHEGETLPDSEGLGPYSMAMSFDELQAHLLNLRIDLNELRRTKDPKEFRNEAEALSSSLWVAQNLYKSAISSLKSMLAPEAKMSFTVVDARAVDVKVSVKEFEATTRIYAEDLVADTALLMKMKTDLADLNNTLSAAQKLLNHAQDSLVTLGSGLNSQKIKSVLDQMDNDFSEVRKVIRPVAFPKENEGLWD